MTRPRWLRPRGKALAPKSIWPSKATSLYHPPSTAEVPPLAALRACHRHARRRTRTMPPAVSAINLLTRMAGVLD